MILHGMPISAQSRFALALTAFLALTCNPCPAQRHPDMRIDRHPVPGSSMAIDPQIAASGEKVYVVWSDDRNGRNSGDIHFNRSLDGGATWLPNALRLDTDLPGSAQSTAPRIAAVDESVYVVWEETRENLYRDIYFNKSNDCGSTWLNTDLRLNTTSSFFGTSKPELSASGDSVFVTWGDTRNHIGFDFPRRMDIYFNRSLDGGRTWLNDDLRVETDSSSHMSVFPKIMSEGSSVYVIWSDERNGNPDIYFNRSLDDGSSWLLSDRRLDTDSPGIGGSLHPQLAVAGEAVFAVWRDSRQQDPVWGPYDVYFNRSPDRGSSWLSSDLKLSRTPGQFSVGIPQVASSSDLVIVAWPDGRFGGSIFCNRSLDQGATWLSSDVRVDRGSGELLFDGQPRVTVLGMSVYAIWARKKDGEADIFFNRSSDGGINWLSSDIRLDGDQPGAAASLRPEIAMGGESVYVTWQDERNGSSDIYFTIPFGALPYGEGTPGTGGNTPTLHGTDALTLGSTFTLSINNAIGGAAGLLAVGGPGSKADIPLAGGSLLIDPIGRLVPIVLGGSAGVPGEGAVNIQVPIPSFPELIGFNLNFQAALLDPAAVAGMTLTNAIEAWIL